MVYFATCVSRSMGPARGDSETAAIHDKVMSVLAKAGYDVVLPADLGAACCGLVFDSRGLPAQGETQLRALEATLAAASERGRHPILLDTSPCVMRLKDHVTDPALKAAIYEPAEFASKHLLPRLAITPQKASVAMHVPCSGKKMKVDKHFEAVMLACASSVTVSPVPCCGMAGDRGLRCHLARPALCARGTDPGPPGRYPEISGGGTASAVAAPPGPAMVLTRVEGKTVSQAGVWPADVRAGCSEGYSTSRTCEMSLSKQTETHFKSLFYLLDKVSPPPPPPKHTSPHPILFPCFSSWTRNGPSRAESRRRGRAGVCATRGGQGMKPPTGRIEDGWHVHWQAGRWGRRGGPRGDVRSPCGGAGMRSGRCPVWAMPAARRGRGAELPYTFAASDYTFANRRCDDEELLVPTEPRLSECEV